MSEPIYEFIKGQGWVLVPPKTTMTYAAWYENLELRVLVCTRCGIVSGYHEIRADDVLICVKTRLEGSF